MAVTPVPGSLDLETNRAQFTLNKAKQYRLAKKPLLGHEPQQLQQCFRHYLCKLCIQLHSDYL